VPWPYLGETLRRNPGQVIIDPWVQERRSLCVLEQGRLTGAAHLLRYGSGPEVGSDYQNAGDVAWYLYWPESGAAGSRLLEAAEQQMTAWGVERRYAWDSGLPIALLSGVPDAWPHVAEALEAAGYRWNADRDEAVFAGRLGQIAMPGAGPLPNMAIERTMGHWQTRFTALCGGEAVGHCECSADLTGGGAVPAMRGWGELGELYVLEGWRSRGVGAWLVRHAAAWLRLGGCDRVVLSVAAADEAAGAGRFYQRQGWDALARFRKGWRRA
jgi:GNAT superfamily N-acetyltransferase